MEQEQGQGSELASSALSPLDTVILIQTCHPDHRGELHAATAREDFGLWTWAHGCSHSRFLALALALACLFTS